MTLDAPKINATFEGKFGTRHEKDEAFTPRRFLVLMRRSLLLLLHR